MLLVFYTKCNNKKHLSQNEFSPVCNKKQMCKCNEAAEAHTLVVKRIPSFNAIFEGSSFIPYSNSFLITNSCFARSGLSLLSTSLGQPDAVIFRAINFCTYGLNKSVDHSLQVQTLECLYVVCVYVWWHLRV